MLTSEILNPKIRLIIFHPLPYFFSTLGMFRKRFIVIGKKYNSSTWIKWQIRRDNLMTLPKNQLQLRILGYLEKISFGRSFFYSYVRYTIPIINIVIWMSHLVFIAKMYCIIWYFLYNFWMIHILLRILNDLYRMDIKLIFLDSSKNCVKFYVISYEEI